MGKPDDPGASSTAIQTHAAAAAAKRLPLRSRQIIAYDDYGDRDGVPLVLLLHANPGDHHDFDGIIPALARRYRVIALGWPGYGDSPAPKGTGSADLFANVLAEFTDALDITGAIFIGVSAGAYAAARLAIEHPERVGALVLVSPAGFTDRTWPVRLAIHWRGTILDTRVLGLRLARRYPRRRTDLAPAIPARVREERAEPERLAVDAAVWRSFARPESDLREEASRIKAPTLLVFGYRDPLIRVERDGRAALAAIPGARALALATGHEPFAEQPAAFLDAVMPFLDLLEAPERPRRDPIRRGIVFVHGVGSQNKSQTLLDFTVPIMRWLQRWSTANGTPAPSASRADLGFTPFDTGQTDRPSQVTIDPGNGDTWLCTEEWWSHSTLRPDFQQMLLWLSRTLGDVIMQLLRAMLQRFQRDTRDPDERTRSPRLVVRGLDMLYAVVMGFLFAVGLALLYPLLALLVLIGMIPIDVLQGWVYATALRAFVEINVAELRVLAEDPVQIANINTRLARNIKDLLRAGCGEVLIVAHSGGAVASFAMLTDPDPALRETARHVTKLITMGCGLNKAWLFSPRAESLRRTLPPHIHWLDIWATYDPVPAGWLDPRPLSKGWPTLVPIFRPSAALALRQRYTLVQTRHSPNPYGKEARELAGHDAPHALDGKQVRWPVSLEVTNAMSPLSDHGGYMQNDEQVVTRLIAEIDADYYKDSVYWHGAHGTHAAPDLRRAIGKRLARVGLLAAARLPVAAAVVALVGWLEGGLLGAGGFGALGRGMGDVPARATLAHHLAGKLAPVGDHLGTFKTLPMSALGALVLALAGYLVYSLYRVLFWAPSDARAQDRRVTEHATLAGPRSAAMLYPGGLAAPGGPTTYRYPPRPPLVRPFTLLRLVALVIIVLVLVALA